MLVVIGVHSPKFEHERDPDALAAAVERYGVDHPVLDDPELVTWQQYAAKAWPTLAVVDPEGYVVASMAGEGHAEGLARLIDELIAHARGEGHPAPRRRARTCRRRSRETALRFPGKAIAAARRRPAGLRLGPPLAGRAGAPTARRSSAGSAPASAAGPTAPPADASFSEPQGLCLLPDAGRRGRRLRRGRRRHRQPPAARRAAATPARSPRSPAPAGSGAPPWTTTPTTPLASTSPRRGTWPGTTTG